MPSLLSAENRRKRYPGVIVACLWAVGCGSTLPLVETPPPDLGVWRGLEVVAENRCSTYDADDYSYPQSLEDDIIAELDGSSVYPVTQARSRRVCDRTLARKASGTPPPHRLQRRRSRFGWNAAMLRCPPWNSSPAESR